MTTAPYDCTHVPDEVQPTPRKMKRTEWITREYDAEGVLVSETMTVKFEANPKADARPDLGGYL